MRPIFATAPLLLALAIALGATVAGNAAQKVVLYYFYGTGCVNCAKTQPIVEQLAYKYRTRGLTLQSYEVWYNTNNRALLLRLAQERGKSVQGVPVVIIGRDVYMGVKSISEIERRINTYLK
ncbi:MAG TPA: thioredoxin family protein [Spirochaetota bacterium]|nr:thioredoxin family protein [Spirochaetota bacterium]